MPFSTSSLNSSTCFALQLHASEGGLGLVEGAADQAGRDRAGRGTARHDQRHRPSPSGSSAGTPSPSAMTTSFGTVLVDSARVTSGAKPPASARICVASSSGLPARSVGTGAGVLPSEMMRVSVSPSSSSSPAAGRVPSTVPGVEPSSRLSCRSTSNPSASASARASASVRPSRSGIVWLGVLSSV